MGKLIDWIEQTLKKIGEALSGKPLQPAPVPVRIKR
jgi:hypothetical protein